MSTSRIQGHTLIGQTKEILWNVQQFMLKEAEEAKTTLFDKERFQKVTERTASATGVSRRTISRILQERDAFFARHAGSSSQLIFETPKKGRTKKACLLDLDDFVYQVIRRKIYDYQLIEKQAVTARSLLTILQLEINFTGSRETLRKILKELGFKHKKKTGTHRKLLVEIDLVRLLRLKYLTAVKTYRTEGRKFVYGFETQMNVKNTRNPVPTSKGLKLNVFYAGTANGLVPNTLNIYEPIQTSKYHCDRRKSEYEKWMRENLIPSLEPNSVFVIDNKLYQKTLEQTAPNADATLWDMQEWLESKNIYFEKNELKSDLYDVIKMHKHQYVTYSLDTIMEAHGHQVLPLPPYHPDLNAMGYIWLEVKDHVLNHNTGTKVDEVKKLLYDKFSSIGSKEWHRVVHTMISCEDYFFNLENTIGDGLDQININTIDSNSVSKDLSTSSSSDSEPEGSKSSYSKSFSENSDSDSSSDDYLVVTSAAQITMPSLV